MKGFISRETVYIYIVLWTFSCQALLPFWGLQASAFYLPAVLLILLIGAFKAPLRRSSKTRIEFLSIFFFLFVYLVLVTLVEHDAESLTASAPIYTNLISLLAFFLITVILTSITYSQVSLQRLLLGVCAIGSVVSILVIAGHVYSGFTDFRILWSEHRNYLYPALYISLSVFSLSALAYYQRRRRLLLLTLLLLNLTALTFSLSRTALVGTLLGILFSAAVSVFATGKVRMRSITAIALTSPALFLFIYKMFPERTAERFSRLFQEGGYAVLDQRYNTWSRALEELNNLPIYGGGVASWWPSHPHNIFLQLAMDAGPAGVLLGILLFGAPFWLVVKTWSLSESANARIFIFFSGSAYFLVFVEFMKSHNFYVAPLVFFILSVVFITYDHVKMSRPD